MLVIISNSYLVLPGHRLGLPGRQHGYRARELLGVLEVGLRLRRTLRPLLLLLHCRPAVAAPAEAGVGRDGPGAPLAGLAARPARPLHGDVGHAGRVQEHRPLPAAALLVAQPVVVLALGAAGWEFNGVAKFVVKLRHWECVFSN